MLIVNNVNLINAVSKELEYFIKAYDILAEKTFQKINELLAIAAIHHGGKVNYTKNISTISKETYDLHTQLIDILLRIIDSYIFKGILI